MEEEIQALISECAFTTSRSSGPGGQNVNKTETRVELRFNIQTSKLLSTVQKQKLLERLKYRLADNETSLILTAQDTRSQLKNKVLVTKRFCDLIRETLKDEAPRIPTKPTRDSVEKRHAEKKESGIKKSLRGNLKNRDWE
ncbi:MAG: aminoacyl-tRNA hydrolase [Saprospiraceae bacterium]|nr:aminoacyl-tRNA hydrolase [Saprospiraceae bacterium]